MTDCQSLVLTLFDTGMAIACMAGMNQSRNIIFQLRELASLESQLKNGAPAPQSVQPAQSTVSKQIEAIRSQIPTSILGHYDHRRSRGKLGVAVVRNGVCGACHLRIPLGQAASLRVSSELNVCGHCGVFLYSEEEIQPAKEHLPKPASTKRPSTKRTVKLPKSRRVLDTEIVAGHL